MGNLSHVRRCSDRNSNWELLESKSEVLPCQLTSSVNFRVTTQNFIVCKILLEIYVGIFLSSEMFHDKLTSEKVLS
jgi:hypothetical protein